MSVSRAQASRSAAVKAKLDYPVIDTDLHTIEYTPLLEDYIHKFFEGTAVEAKLGVAGSVRAAE